EHVVPRRYDSLPVLRGLLKCHSADDEHGPRPQHTQLRWLRNMQALLQTCSGDVGPHAPGERLRLEQGKQFTAVALTPLPRIEEKDQLHVAAASRVVPISTMRRIPASESASAAVPAAVNRYGRRRSSASSGSISPRSSR